MNARSQHGGSIATNLLAWIFRAAIFCVFAPVAWRYATHSQWIETSLALGLALYLGALLAPTED